MSESTDDLRHMSEALEATWNGLSYSYGNPGLIDWAANRIDALTEALEKAEAENERLTEAARTLEELLPGDSIRKGIVWPLVPPAAAIGEDTDE